MLSAGYPLADVDNANYAEDIRAQNPLLLAERIPLAYPEPVEGSGACAVLGGFVLAFHQS